MSNPGVAWETGEERRRDARTGVQPGRRTGSGRLRQVVGGRDAPRCTASRGGPAAQSAVRRSAGHDRPGGGGPLVRQYESTTGAGGQGPAILDPAWEDHPGFFALRQSYVAALGLAEDVLEAGRGGGADGWRRQGRDGDQADLRRVAPTNFLPTNPAALKRAFETAGASLVSGGRHFVDDLLHNGGRPRQVDTTAVRARREPRRDARQGGVSQRADGADPVRAADASRCTRFRCSPARRGSTSTT